MVAFYNQGDQAIYDSGQYFIPQEKYRLNYNAPVIEEEQENSIGIPNTNSFINFANSNDRNFNNNFNTGNFQPYTAQPSGSFVTNRTDYGSRGYLPGTEPEETFMDTAGGIIRKGIGFAIPGGNFLMGMADNFSRENRLNAQDNAFIDMQLANQEQNIHGFGNLTNQDRYGYNKDSLTGNYANVVADRVAIANQRLKDNKELRPIDQYYLEKQKEEDDVKNQIDFNNFVRQRITANNIRNRIKNDPTYDENFNIHGGNNKVDTGDGDGGGGFGGYANVQAYDAANKATYDRIRDMHGGGGGGGNTSATNSQGMTSAQHGAFRMARGGLASL
tara:strand:+ start:726 stop:1718 length:993 start_codon:yes stop_codon:yes gene_type:complete